jgi:uncharacterized membrane protein
MRNLARLGALVADLVRRTGTVIVTRFDLVEVKILSLGLLVAALLGLGLLYLAFADPRLYRILSSTAVLHVMGGRALGVTTCLSAGLSVGSTIAYNFLVEVVIVFIAYGVVVLIMRNVIQPKLLKATVRQAELTAQRQRTTVKRFGAVGLFLFVMFPFVMTGPVIGAIIGYLLNYRPASNFAIVLSGTLTAIVVYALLGQNLLALIGRVVDLEQVQLWGGLAIAAVVVAVLAYHIGTVRRILEEGRER